MYESEGEGLGRCMFVLMGGRSGGHQAAVLASVKYGIPLLLFAPHLIYKFFSPFIRSSRFSQPAAYVISFPLIYSQSISIDHLPDG